jgi:hypothetical protein
MSKNEGGNLVVVAGSKTVPLPDFDCLSPVPTVRLDWFERQAKSSALTTFALKSGAVRMTTKRSPACNPGLSAGRPRPGTRSVMPSSTPTGIRMVTASLRTACPVPPHSGHGLSRIVPLPVQSGQVVICRKVTPCLRWLRTSCPLPPHLSQVRGFVPTLAPDPLQAWQVLGRFT